MRNLYIVNDTTVWRGQDPHENGKYVEYIMHGFAIITFY